MPSYRGEHESQQETREEAGSLEKTLCRGIFLGSALAAGTIALIRSPLTVLENYRFNKRVKRDQKAKFGTYERPGHDYNY